MSFLDKIMFWKKDDFADLDKDLALGDDFKDPSQPDFKDPSQPDFKDPSQPDFKDPSQPDFKNPSQPSPDFRGSSQNDNLSRPSSFASFQSSQQPSQANFSNRDLELMFAKLDSLKAMLESVNHRLDNVERLIKGL